MHALDVILVLVLQREVRWEVCVCVYVNVYICMYLRACVSSGCMWCVPVSLCILSKVYFEWGVSSIDCIRSRVYLECSSVFEVECTMVGSGCERLSQAISISPANFMASAITCVAFQDQQWWWCWNRLYVLTLCVIRRDDFRLSNCAIMNVMIWSIVSQFSPNGIHFPINSVNALHQQMLFKWCLLHRSVLTLNQNDI